MHFNETMPKQLGRGHADPEWVGDRLGILAEQRAAINKAKAHKQKLPPPSRDMNFHWYYKNLKDKTVKGGGNFRCLHWGRPDWDNYHFYLEPGAKKARPMTKAELKKKTWTDGQIARWRRTEDPKSAHPPRYLSCAIEANRVEVYCIPELKNPFPFWAAQQLVAEAKKADHPAWTMALLNLPKCRQKCEFIQKAGGDFALIFGSLAPTAQKPGDWNQWNPKPTRIWNGSKRLLAWL